MSDDTQDTEAPGPLRDKIKEQAAEIKELREFKRGVVFEKAGLDPSRGIGKAVFKEYDGDLDAEAIRTYATAEYEWQAPSDEDDAPAAAEPSEREQAQGRVRDVLGESKSSGASPNVEFGDYKQMLKTNPQEAMRLRSEGLVKVPEHVAAS